MMMDGEQHQPMTTISDADSGIIASTCTCSDQAQEQQQSSSSEPDSVVSSSSSMAGDHDSCYIPPDTSSQSSQQHLDITTIMTRSSPVEAPRLEDPCTAPAPGCTTTAAVITTGDNYAPHSGEISVGSSKSATTRRRNNVTAANNDKEKEKDREIRQAFPIKVYEMLEEADDKGFSHVVSWNGNGTGFMVHEREAFIRDIVPNYFNQTRYKSFQRQLSLYGFQRITVGPQKGLRFHEKLRRGDRALVKSMKPVGYKPRGPPKDMILEHIAHHHQQQRQQQQQQQQEQQEEAARDHDPEDMDLSFNMGIPMVASISSIPTVVSSNSLDKQQQEQTQEQQSRDVTTTAAAVASTNDNGDHGSEVATSQLLATYREAQIDCTSSNHFNVADFEGNTFYIMTSQQGAISAGLEDGSVTAQGRLPISSSSSSLQGLIASHGFSDSGRLHSDLQKAWEIGFRHAEKQLLQTCPTSTFHTSTETTSDVVAPSPNFLPTVSPAVPPRDGVTTTELAPLCPQLRLDECVDALDFYSILSTQQ